MVKARRLCLLRDARSPRDVYRVRRVQRLSPLPVYRDGAGPPGLGWHGPNRAAMLTGRNHHSVGVGSLTNLDSGYPGYRDKIAKEAGTLTEMLKPHDYRSYMVGKWHVTPLTESGSTGPF